MLFWHLGVTAAIVFVALGWRRIDYRVVLLGAVLPDLIDKPLGRLLFDERFQSGHIFGHTLVFPLGLLLVIQLTLRGDRARRWYVLPIAVLLHLALDAMWTEPITLFWPAFGTQFPPAPVDQYWVDVLLRPFRVPLEGVKELIGLGLLVYLGYGFDLHRRQPLREFLRTGRLSSGRTRPPAGPRTPGAPRREVSRENAEKGLEAPSRSVDL
jgi:inner membrane protein